MLLKPILETTFGTDTVVLSSSAIQNCIREKEKYYHIFTRVLCKNEEKQAALVLAHCPPC